MEPLLEYDMDIQNPWTWGKPCECCGVKPASGVFMCAFRIGKRVRPKVVRLCADCGFTKAYSRWTGGWYDEDCKEFVARPKVLTIKLISSITHYQGA